MDSNPQCLMYGAIVSVLVSALKRITFVKRHPKMVALALVTITPAIRMLIARESVPVDVSALLTCLAIEFGSAVAVHETVVNPVRRSLV